MNLQSTIATRMEETPRTSAVFMQQCKEQPQRGQVWTCGSQAETYCTHALPEVPRSYRNFAYSALARLQDGDVWVGGRTNIPAGGITHQQSSWGPQAFRFEKKKILVHCCVHLFFSVECTECYCPGKMDPNRDLAISFRSKTVSNLFKIYLGSTNFACQLVEPR